MDHETAQRLEAADRYAAGELSTTERDEFEAHLADCSRCTEDVWAAASFAANLRAVFLERATAPPAPLPWWRQWLQFGPAPRLAFATALNIVLAAVLAYSLLRVQPNLREQLAAAREPQLAQVFQVRGLVRGAPPTLSISAASPYAVLSCDLPREYQRYSYTIQNRSGGVRLAGELSPPPHSDALSLMVPVATLGPGEYEFRLSGSDGAQSDVLASGRLQIRPR